MTLTPYRRIVLTRLATGPKTLVEARAGHHNNIMPTLIREGFAQHLKDGQYEITQAGIAALNQGRGVMPDTICIDAVPGEPIIDLAEAVRQVEEKLPGWCWKVGTCCVSDDAWVAPDFNCPVHGERLKRELGPVEFNSVFDAGVDVDRRPSGNVGQALLDAMNAALMAIERQKICIEQS